MGSPAFALPSLEALVAAGHRVSLAVTQPARPAGRGQREVQPPVAQLAAGLGIDLFQPDRLRSTPALERIREQAPDAIVVAAYGRILPKTILDLPPLGCLNVHPSLLPRHRGASPISGAILAGDTETGVSIMLIDEGMDTGPVLVQRTTIIEVSDDQVSLTDRLAKLSAALLLEALDGRASQSIAPEPQNADLATYTRPASAGDGLLDWNESAAALWRRVRAYAEWPQAHTQWNGRQLRILRASYDESIELEPGRVAEFGPPRRAPLAAAIGTARGALLPEILGLEGRRPLAIAEFLRGAQTLIGAQLGT